MNKPADRGVDVARDDLEGVLAWGTPGESSVSQPVAE